MIIKQFILLIFLLAVAQLWSQQNPHLSLFRQHFNVFNPAFVGTQGATLLNMTYRTQWLGIEDAPITQAISFGTPTRGERIGLGFSVNNDKTFVEKQMQAFINVSYRLQLNENLNLYLGVQGGLNSFSINSAQLEVFNPKGIKDYQLLLVQSSVNPNVGVGIYLKHQKYYFSLSAPKILTSKRFKNVEGLVTTPTDRVHIYASGGLFIPLSEQWEFIPAFLISYVKAAPLHFTINTGMSFNKKIDFGLEYNIFSGLGGQIILNKKNKISFGYAYTTSANSEINQFSSGTHEALLQIKIAKF